MGELELWKALVCFGRKQVDKTLQDPQWRKDFPDVFRRLDSKERRVKYDTLIPLRMLKAMAMVTPNAFAYGIRADTLICRQSADKIPSNFAVISALEALNSFGSERLFEAAEYGTSAPPPSDSTGS